MKTVLRMLAILNFSIERGKLYIHNVCIAKRTNIANMNIVLQLFQEGKIELSEAIDRVSIEDIDAMLFPEITNYNTLDILGNGIPVSPGAATGQLVISREKAEEFSKQGQDYIFARFEVSPEDIGFMENAKGILTARGGRTSHAAVVSRGMEKPCVSGCCEIGV